MNQTRLSSLALMHVHYEHVIDTDKVIDIFCVRQPRKLELQNLFANNSYCQGDINNTMHENL